MNLYTNAARRIRQTFDYDAAYDAARDKIADALFAGQSVKCGTSTADLADAAEHAYTRTDADRMFAELVTGLITPEQFKAWVLRQVYDYADNMAVDLANDMLSSEIDNAEYMQGDR